MLHYNPRHVSSINVPVLGGQIVLSQHLVSSLSEKRLLSSGILYSGIATAYGMDGRGIESRWGRDFPHLSRPELRPTQPPVQWVPGLSRGLVAAGA